MKVLVAIFNPAEFYPPTINAVEYLASTYEEVVLLTHAVENTGLWQYPKNVRAEYIHDWPTDIEASGHWPNIKRFLRYSQKLGRLLRSEQFDIVLLYEPYAALAYRISTIFSRNRPKVLWYHNHDVVELNSQGTFSIGRRAIVAEKAIFPQLSIFSLPAEERKTYFPMDKLGGRYFFLPNYPSKQFYGKFYKPKTPSGELKLIFQGRIAEGHGLETIITLLKEKINGVSLSLHLKGIISENYKQQLIKISVEQQVQDKLFFYGPTSYQEVPVVASTCHVGIAIHTKTDIMNKTLGTSSNKIYEYAAVGLPVLLFDNPHFKKHLEKFQWAIFTDVSRDSLIDSLKRILMNYREFSEAAHRDFSNNLNFEDNIRSVTDYIDSQKN